LEKLADDVSLENVTGSIIFMSKVTNHSQDNISRRIILLMLTKIDEIKIAQINRRERESYYVYNIGYALINQISDGLLFDI